ncbi:MAG: lysylphosphatidylglycerol synthase transmembrane domain-containing protein [Chloroflexota bacterium]
MVPEVGVCKPRYRRWAAVALRWVVGIGLLVLALRQVDPGALITALRRVDGGWLLTTLLTILLGIGLKALRWKLLLQPVCPDRSGWDVLGILLSGQAANIVLPLRGGEVLRAALIVPPSDGRAGAVLVGIGMEKAFDLLVLAASAGLALPLLPAGAPSSNWVRPLAAGLVLLGVVMAGGVFSPRAWTRLRPLLNGLPVRTRDRLRGWFDGLSTGLEQLVHSGHLSRVLALTALIWLVMLATNLVLLRALAMQVSAGAAALVLVAVHLGLMPALMPGNVGPFYLAVEVGLSPFGYGLELAALYAILLHALVTLPPLLGAALYLAASRRGSTS